MVWSRYALLLLLLMGWPIRGACAQDSKDAFTYVPEDAVFILQGDLERLRETPAVQHIASMLKTHPKVAELAEKTALLEIISEFVLVLPPSGDSSTPGPLLIASTALSSEALLGLTEWTFTTSTHLGTALHTAENGLSLAFPKKGSLLMGDLKTLQRALDHADGQSPPAALLKGVVKEADSRAALWFALHVNPALSPKLTSDLPLFEELHSMHGALHFAEGFTLELHFRFTGVEASARFHTLFSREIESASLDPALNRLGFSPLVSSIVLTQSDTNVHLYLSVRAEELQLMLDTTRSILIPSP